MAEYRNPLPDIEVIEENWRYDPETGNALNARARWRPNILPTGVSRDKRTYAARIRIEGKSIHIGNFDTPEEAQAAYLAKSGEYFGEQP